MRIFSSTASITFKWSALIILFLFFSGCGSVLKQRWTNFRSYYNTFFNASQSFQAGYKIQLEQNRDLNPEQPVRIHPPTVRAGSSNFQNAIEKSADLLRRFPESKWTDDAIFLIGRSYFFQQELFSALEKFSELYRIADDPILKQQAVYWKGRTYLELRSYQQGIDYLNNELSKDELDWKKGILAEAQAVLAELYIQLEDFERAKTALEPSLGKLISNEENAYAYFLYGQLLERFNQPDDALAAYRRVPKYNPKYNVIYQARRKEAEIARNQGYFKESLKLYNKMARDDKNFDIVTELEYEVARTYLGMEEYNEAERRYYDLLYESIQNVTNLTKAKAYNDLGVIFKEGYQDLFIAQAYFDSSAALRPDPNLMPEDYQAPELAENLGTYVQLKFEINDSDSLLRLGRMSEEELDSVLVIIRERKKAELEELERQRRKEQNTLVNMNAGASTTQNQNSTNTSGGFLNHRNQQLINDNAARFRAIWGNRPLVPNWRRIEAVRSQQLTNQSQVDSTQNTQEVAQNSLSEFNIDLSAIPFTPEAQSEMEQGIVLRKYQLGNLFYLQLNEPDSALFYFQEVIQYEDTLEVQPQATYAVVELLYNSEDQEGALFHLDLLDNRYPTSVYTKSAATLVGDSTIIKRFLAEQGIVKDQTALDFNALLKEIDQKYPLRVDTTQTLVADQWIDFALANPTSVYGAMAFENGMKPLILWATAALDYNENLSTLVQKVDSVEKIQQQFSIQKDSLRTILADTNLVLTEDQRLDYQAVVDSTLPSFDPTLYFPYVGSRWDEVRNRLPLKDSLEILIPSKPWWDELEKELELPGALKPPVVVVPIVADTTTFYDCTDATWAPIPLVEPQAFYQDSVRIPRSMQSLKYFGDLAYDIQTDTAGKVIEIEFKNEPTGTGIEMVLERAIKDKFKIQPLIVENKKIQARCTYIFPVVLGSQD